MAQAPYYNYINSSPTSSSMSPSAGGNSIPGLPQGWTQDASGNRYYNGSPALTNNYTNGQLTSSSMAPSAPSAPSGNPPGGTATSPTQNTPSNGFPTGYLNPFPLSSDYISMLVNQANGATAAGAQQQAQGQLNQAAAQGFGAGSGATAGNLNNIYSNALGQQAQNAFNIPLMASQFNTGMQQGAAQLGTQGLNTTNQFLTGLAGNNATAIGQLLQFLSGGIGSAIGQ